MTDSKIKSALDAAGTAADGENPVLNLMRTFCAAAGFQEVPPTKTYTRDDLVRAILGQQWAVAVACHAWQGAETWINDDGPQRRLADLPCAVDVVEGMPAQSEGYVIDSIIEDRARLKRLVEDYDRRFAMLAKIAQGIEEKVGRYLVYHGPSCDEHLDDGDECSTCRMDTEANDAISELKFWSKA